MAESNLETAKRNVREAEEHVLFQEEMVEALRRDGHSTKDAEEVLAAFVESLDAHRQALSTLQAAKGGSHVGGS